MPFLYSYTIPYLASGNLLPVLHSDVNAIFGHTSQITVHPEVEP
jgi:hypothetical protein